MILTITDLNRIVENITFRFPELNWSDGFSFIYVAIYAMPRLQICFHEKNILGLKDKYLNCLCVNLAKTELEVKSGTFKYSWTYDINILIVPFWKSKHDFFLKIILRLFSKRVVKIHDINCAQNPLHESVDWKFLDVSFFI